MLLMEMLMVCRRDRLDEGAFDSGREAFRTVMKIRNDGNEMFVSGLHFRFGIALQCIR